MKTKELIVNFRYVFGNIACMSVMSTTGKPVENDINNEDAIKMFNALIGEKENSIIQENKQLKDNWEILKHALIGRFNTTQDTIYLDILTDIMKPIEEGAK